MSSIPITCVDNIISFLRPTEKMNINSKYRKSVIANSKKIIKRNVIKWCEEYNERMNESMYFIPKKVYKKFYPLKFRISFMEEVFDLLVEDCKRYNIVSNLMTINNNLVDNFNSVIDILTEEELFILGW